MLTYLLTQGNNLTEEDLKEIIQFSQTHSRVTAHCFKLTEGRVGYFITNQHRLDSPFETFKRVHTQVPKLEQLRKSLLHPAFEKQIAPKSIIKRVHKKKGTNDIDNETVD